jgi:beta-carotene 3-hydroxylase
VTAGLSHALVFVPVAVVVAVLMDPWAALLHGRLWHGVLWAVHRSHHEPRTGVFEKNDLFALVHAPVAMALILYGCVGQGGALREVLFGIGVGMTAFAVGYLVVHDGLVHGRLPVAFLLKVKVMRRIVRAHRVHHAGTAGGAPYGLFLGPAELLRRGKALRKHAAPRRPGGVTTPR